jgi:hypothetical protein
VSEVESLKKDPASGNHPIGGSEAQNPTYFTLFDNTPPSATLEATSQDARDGIRVASLSRFPPTDIHIHTSNWHTLYRACAGLHPNEVDPTTERPEREAKASHAIMARVYADVNQQMPRAYWDYDSVNISWGVLENYEVVRKIGKSSTCLGRSHEMETVDNR